MKAIFISDNGRNHYKYNIKMWMLFVLPVAVLLLMSIATTIVSSYFSGNALSASDVLIINRFDSYLKRLSTLEAHTQRLNALGARIALRNHIDIDTFLLEKEPGRGGVVDNGLNKRASILSEQDLIESIKKSEQVIVAQEKTFDFYKDLKTVAKNYKLLSKPVKIIEEHLYSSPVNKGYISSAYGFRRDPINGKHRNHRGIDIAGRTGTLINTIASGFVSFTGRKGGYGKVVEIQHTDSLKSRYAHLNVISVREGQVVRKGDNIAKMGSTGRVTGPHLHLEVWKNGKTVNPSVYLKDALGGLKKR